VTTLKPSVTVSAVLSLTRLGGIRIRRWRRLSARWRTGSGATLFRWRTAVARPLAGARRSGAWIRAGIPTRSAP